MRKRLLDSDTPLPFWIWLLFAIVSAGFVVYGPIVGYLRSLEPFDAARWRSTPPEQRETLARAFLRDRNDGSLTEADVRKLLGDPDRVEETWRYRIDGTYFGDLVVNFEQGAVSATTQDSWAQSSTTRRPFDRKRWATGSATLRGWMMNDLIAHDRLYGRHTAAVRQALGAPTSQRRRLLYPAGEYLSFKIGRDGRVEAGVVGWNY